jgi:hypothetical protein
MVTFDLHGGRRKYDAVRRDLAVLHLRKSLRMTTPLGVRSVKLPANTFVGRVSTDAAETARELRDQAMRAVKAVFKLHRLSATIYLAVGENAASKRVSVQPV